MRLCAGAKTGATSSRIVGRSRYGAARRTQELNSRKTLNRPGISKPTILRVFGRSHGQMTTKPFTLVSYTGPALRRGRYVFQFQGFNPGGAFAAAGSFVADEFGTIGDAVLDTNGIIGPPVTNLALSGTYSFDANNLGTMTLTGPQGNATFRFALYPSASNGISAGGKIIEFDNIKSGTGFITAQDNIAFSKSAISGDYLFNFAGSSASLGRV